MTEPMKDTLLCLSIYCLCWWNAIKTLTAEKKMDSALAIEKAKRPPTVFISKWNFVIILALFILLYSMCVLWDVKDLKLTQLLWRTIRFLEAACTYVCNMYFTWQFTFTSPWLHCFLLCLLFMWCCIHLLYTVPPHVHNTVAAANWSRKAVIDWQKRD